MSAASSNLVGDARLEDSTVSDDEAETSDGAGAELSEQLSASSLHEDSVPADCAVLWASLDPVRRCIDFYPRAIAQRLEAALGSGEDRCVLGADFFNATVHLPPDGGFCQTTPGQHMGRSGYKAPGFRSACRIVHPRSARTVTLHGRRVQGEWRLAESGDDAEYSFVEVAPAHCMLCREAAEEPCAPLQTWGAADMGSSDPAVLRKPVVVWQWCRGTPERDGDPMRLGDEMWCPYLSDQNTAIEAAFSAGASAAAVDFEARSLRVTFSPGSPFALQVDTSARKERLVRRALKTVGELRELHARMASTDEEVSGAAQQQRRPCEAVPPDFFCPITQDVMVHPYCTVDGFTYERHAIQTWLLQHDTSPLTGLPLASDQLRPNLGLQEEIREWVERRARSLAGGPGGQEE